MTPMPVKLVHNPWAEAARDFGVIAAADLAAIGLHEYLTKPKVETPEQLYKLANHLAVTKSIRGLAAREAAYTRNISRMPSGKGSTSIITKTAGVAEDQARALQYSYDKQHNKHRMLTPEASQAVQSAASGAAAYLASKGLSHYNPAFGKAAPYLAGASALYSATDLGKKIRQSDADTNKYMASIIRTNERIKQANIVQELGEEAYAHTVNHELFGHKHKIPKPTDMEKAAWIAGLFRAAKTADTAVSAAKTAWSGASNIQKGVAAGAAAGSFGLGRLSKGNNEMHKSALFNPLNTLKNMTKIEKGIAGGIAATSLGGLYLQNRKPSSSVEKQAFVQAAVDNLVHGAHGALHHLGENIGHLTGGNIQKYVAKATGKATPEELTALHAMDDSQLLGHFEPGSQQHNELIRLMQMRKASRTAAVGGAGLLAKNKLEDRNGYVY